MVMAGANTRARTELPDAPRPQVQAEPAEETAERRRKVFHQRFYSGRATRITLGLELGAWVADMAYTCRNLASRHGSEDWLPTNTCAQTVALTAGFHAAGEGVAYLLHRLGHHKLEQIPRWYLTGGNVAGAAFTSANAWHPSHAYPMN